MNTTNTINAPQRLMSRGGLNFAATRFIDPRLAVISARRMVIPHAVMMNGPGSYTPRSRAAWRRWGTRSHGIKSNQHPPA
jgi:hypothetical protein